MQALQKRYSKRFTYTRLAREAYKEGDFINAIKNYNEYLKTMGDIHDLDPLELVPEIFNPEKEFLVTILAKNIGYQLKGYTEKTRSPLPVEIQAATSYKLKHAPFRISLLAHHLNQWDITYNDPNAKETIDALTGDTIPVSRAGFFEKLANHFTYQLEVLITKNIEVRAGFDYHKRKELALEQRSGIAGFSFGAGLLLDKFRLDYGFVVYSRAGFNNMITLSTNLSKWKK